LSHSASPFLCWIFQDKVSQTLLFQKWKNISFLLLFFLFLKLYWGLNSGPHLLGLARLN
jgi:hypothetical protein